MIHRLIEFSMRNRGLVIAIYLGLAAWGYWALLRTPIDAIPDLSENQVIVFTDWTGRSPQEVEDHVAHRGLLGQPPGVLARGDVHALLQASEVGAALLIERDDLAVQDGLVGAEAPVQARELRIAVADLFEVAAFETHLAGRAVGDRADSVPMG